MLYRFVINSSAGSVQLDRARELIQDEFADLPHELIIDPSAAGLETACRPGSGSESVTVVAVGGDGTVNRVINAMSGPGVTMGLIPLGTANDLAAALGIPKSLRSACRVIRDGRTVSIDLVDVNGRLFVTCGGIGLAAEAAACANRWRASRRFLGRAARSCSYPLAAILELARGVEPARLRIACGAASMSAATMTLIVSNQARFGGRFTTSPDASNTDGLIDVCEIQAPRSRARMLWVILRALCGGVGRMREVARWRVEAATLVASRPIPFFGDGETLMLARDFEIHVLPSALRILAPVGGAP